MDGSRDGDVELTGGRAEGVYGVKDRSAWLRLAAWHMAATQHWPLRLSF